MLAFVHVLDHAEDHDSSFKSHVLDSFINERYAAVHDASPLVIYFLLIWTVCIYLYQSIVCSSSLKPVSLYASKTKTAI